MSARPGLYGGQPVMVVPTVIDNWRTASGFCRPTGQSHGRYWQWRSSKGGAANGPTEITTRHFCPPSGVGPRRFKWPMKISALCS